MYSCKIKSNKCLLKKLEKLETDDVELFSLDKCKFVAKCVEVYDGDTITIIIYPNLGKKFLKFKVRLAEINAPEFKTKNLEEKKKGIISRDYLRELILGKIIYILCGKFDKFGRLLGTIYLPENEQNNQNTQNVNELLVIGGYAVAHKY